MCYVSRCNHLIIYCTDSVKAEHGVGQREGEHRRAKGERDSDTKGVAALMDFTETELWMV